MKIEHIRLKTSFLIAGVAFLVVVAFALCFQWQVQWRPAAKAKDAVLQRLNDPESARFSDVIYFSRSGATCGNFNAKNRVGGYVGLTGFIQTKDGEIYIEPPGNEPAAARGLFAQLVAANCAEN